MWDSTRFLHQNFLLKWYFASTVSVHNRSVLNNTVVVNNDFLKCPLSPVHYGVGAGGQSEQQIPAMSSSYCIYPFKASLLREHLVNCKCKNQNQTQIWTEINWVLETIIHQHQKHWKYKKDKSLVRPEIYLCSMDTSHL